MQAKDVAVWVLLGVSAANLLASFAVLFAVSGHTQASKQMAATAAEMRVQHKADLVNVQNTISERLLQFMEQAEKRR